jgi:hypothetical protein
VLNAGTVKIYNPHISDDGNNFDDSKDELSFTITFNTKQIDTDDDYQEYSDEDGMIVFSIMVPKIDGNRSSNNLQRENT